MKRRNYIKTFAFTLFFLTSICSFGQEVNEPNKESFDAFLHSFNADSSFQKSRIQFPLKFVTLDYETYEEKILSIEKAEWKFKRLFSYSADSYTQIFDNFETKLRDTDERVFARRGIENGINVFFYFKRIEGKWYLVTYEDSSS